jgi:TPR repeat protein
MMDTARSSSFGRMSARLAAIALALMVAGVFGTALRPGGSAYAASNAGNAERVIRAAKKGDIKAQAYLGWMYANGRGVPQHYHLAATWYLRAAEQGHGGAQFALGLLYNKGQGVSQDFVLAYMWLNLSASQAVGDDRDFKMRVRDGIASKMTIGQVELAQQMARSWYSSVKARRPQ